MGHFVGVYTDELPTLRSVIGSKSPDHFAAALRASGGKFDYDPTTHERISTAIKDLIAGSYPHGDLKDWHYYTYAFEKLCRAFARKWTVEEIYVDEEQCPDLFSFVWGGDSDPADLPLLRSDPFSLPPTQYGPSCFHRPLKIVKQEIGILSNLLNLDYDDLAGTACKDYPEEVAAILEVLEAAERAEQGLFVTFME